MAMIKVGITGGIGSGKSTVTNMLRAKNFPVIDADIVSREVFVLYPEVLYEIRKEFGDAFFDEEDKIKRQELGNYIFKSGARRKKLEDIMMPYIKKEIAHKIKAYEEEDCKICFLDAATLIENNMHTSMDKVILVWIGLDVQVQRVMLRDGLNLNQTMNRIKAQMTLSEKKKVADYIINNEGSVKNTKLQLDSILTQLERLNVKK